MPGTRHHPSPAVRPIALTSVIATHVDKILSSAVFRTADSLRDLLRFTVHETLDGRGADLKEYLLGVHVLHRSDAFDPKIDPIVRTQMRRLREHLGRYYAGEGRYDPIVIEIPKGTYVPTFHPALRDGEVADRGDAPDIVGREKELSILRAAFDDAASGRGHFVCLSGEPGIGKTALVDAFLRGLEASGAGGHHVAHGRCSERLAGTEAYLPLLEALEGLLRRAEPSVIGLMKAVAPAWHAQIAPSLQDLAGEHGSPMGPPVSQERLKRELVTLLEELSRREPLVMVLDDLHWADESTIDMLVYCAARSLAQRLLIVGTYRPADLRGGSHPFAAAKLELQAHGICRDLPLPLLTRDEVNAYLALRFPAHRFDARLSGRIHERTEGNPLFMADLVRFLHDRGVIDRRDECWILVGALGDVERDLPESVRSMVERKIAQLDDDDRRLLVVASVQGNEFDSAVLSKVLALDAALVEERLDELERVHGFVMTVAQREFPDRTISTRYRFVHVLYQNALYASLQPTRKASLSAAVAEALLDGFVTQRSVIAAELAMLFEAARDPRAADYFLLAAEQASGVAANAEAIALARRGLAALTMMAESVERAHRELRLLTTLGPALMSTVGWGAPEVEATYVRARDVCQQIGDVGQLFPIVYGLWGYWHGRAEFATAVQMGEQLLTSAEQLQDSTMLLLAHYSLGNTLAVSGDWERSLTHIKHAIPLYVPEQHRSLSALYGGHDPGVVCRSGQPVNLWMLGYADQAVARASEGLSLAREIGHVPSVAFAIIFDAMLHQHCRDVARCRTSAEAAIEELTTAQELAPLRAWATVLRGWAMVQQGMADDGIALLRDGIDGWRMMGLVFRPYFLCLLAESYGRIGRASDALAAIDEALTITARTREGFAEAELHRLKGERQLDEAAARACFEKAIDVARRQKAKSFELRAATSFARTLHALGKDEEAHTRLAEVYGWFTEGFETADLRDAAALLTTLTAA